MSRCSWRSAEALQKRRKELTAIERADEKARYRRQQETKEWHITGEPSFRPRHRSYPNGGGIDTKACEGFLGSAERAMHLYDRLDCAGSVVSQPEGVKSVHFEASAIPFLGKPFLASQPQSSIYITM